MTALALISRKTIWTFNGQETLAPCSLPTRQRYRSSAKWVGTDLPARVPVCWPARAHCTVPHCLIGFARSKQGRSKQGPDGSGYSVREGDGHQLHGFSGEHLPQTIVPCGFASACGDDALCPVIKQPSDAAVTHFRYLAQPFFAATGMGFGRQTQPRRPNDAARSRAVLRPVASGKVAARTLDAIGPKPGIDFRRRAVASVSEARLILVVTSSTLILGRITFNLIQIEGNPRQVSRWLCCVSRNWSARSRTEFKALTAKLPPRPVPRAVRCSAPLLEPPDRIPSNEPGGHC